MLMEAPSVSRLPHGLFWGLFSGLFSSVRQFHEVLVTKTDPDVDYGGLPPGITGLFAFCQLSSDTVMLTHGDLNSLNILVRDDVVSWIGRRLVGSHRTGACAKNVNPYNASWERDIERFLTPLPQESEMETTRKRCFGTF